MRLDSGEDNEATYETIAYMAEGEYFVGRKQELKKFSDFIDPSSQEYKVLHIYGTGGTGKTYLLHAFQRIAEKQGALFLQLNSLDFIHTPLTLADSLLTLLQAKTNLTFHENSSLSSSLQQLINTSRKTQLIIAIDSYELMRELDHWFRHMFVSQLPSNIRFVLAGRYPLSGDWIESPAWRRMITSINLNEFTFGQTKEYLANHHITQEEIVRQMWSFTKGHPLTLSLAVLATEKKEIDAEDFSFLNQKTEILNQLTYKWLSEVKNERLQEVVEAASCLRQFDQLILSSVLKKEIPPSLFHQLTSLSFVQKRQHGWAIHDLIRDAVRLALKQRNQELLRSYEYRSAAYYLKRLQKRQNAWEIGEFFYHLGDSFIQSTFFHGAENEEFYLEHVSSHNFSKVKQYFRKRKEDLTASHVQFYSRSNDQVYNYHVSKAHNKREEELIDETYVEKFGYNIARLLKNKQGETLGISLIVPVNKQTITPLSKEPVSRAYFQQLSDQEYAAYEVEPPNCAGYFIRMLDCLDPTDTASRSFLLYNLFPLLLSGGHIIVSTPLTFYQELLNNFGFQVIQEATHQDYGETPSLTYLLDVRGQRLPAYLKNFMEKSGLEEDIREIATAFSFTEREADIASLILQEKTNAEIAHHLFLAEVTVKKNISRMLQKAEAKNRAQLIKRMMEFK